MRQDIVICRKTGAILKTTPIDPKICAEFIGPLMFHPENIECRDNVLRNADQKRKTTPEPKSAV